MIIDLGCGGTKHKYPNSICIDRVATKGVDIVYDLNNGIPLENESVDLIYTSHTLEHLNNLVFIMEEIYRVLKKNGKVLIKVPHFSNGIAYADPSHKMVFSVFTFDNFGYYTTTKFRKKYNTDVDFKIVKKELIFHYGFLNKIFNIFNRFQYQYERYFCWIFPCYEVGFVLKKE